MATVADLEQWATKKWAVFPCHSVVKGECTCGRASCKAPGKHPRTSNGVRAATSNLEQLRAWLSRWPDANWALATGSPSGVWVLDIDVKPDKDGKASLEAWLTKTRAEIPATLVVETGGGGWHYYWVESGLGNRTNVLPGVDVRGEGGYVLLPGSTHISGKSYRIASDKQPAHADRQLVELARGASSAPTPPVTATGSLLDPIPEGERDDTLFRMACSLRRKLSDDRQAIETLVVARALASGFSESDALRKVEQAFKQDHSDGATDPSKTDRPRINLIGGDSVRNLPSPSYLIDGVMPRGALFQVFGQTGSYKSFVMLDMLASIANGIEWMGHKVCHSGPVAFILGEGGYDAGLRLEAWLAANPSSSDERIAYSIEEQLDLMDAKIVDALLDDLEAYRLANVGAEPWAMIVFDTQADHMPSGDEDKSRDFTVMKRSIQRIAQATGAAVGLVHHTGWDDSRERGSSRQRQALDVVIQIKNQRITNIKQKAAALFEPIAFDIESFEKSIVVRRVTPLGAAAESLDADLEVGRDVLTYLVEHPGASQNDLVRDLRLGRSGTWPKLRDLLDHLGYLEVVKQGTRVRQVRPTERGLAYFGIDVPS